MSKEHDKVKEIQHVKQALKANNYPDWMLINNTGHWIWFESPNNLVTRREWYASVPYIKATSERLQRPFKSHEVTLVHEPFNSLRSQLVRVEDKTENRKKCPTVYDIRYEQCDKEYVGENSRSLNTRIKEHHSWRNSSAVHEHCQLTGHSVYSRKITVLTTEGNSFKRHM